MRAAAPLGVAARTTAPMPRRSSRTGALITVDNTVDTTTGTVKLRASFANTSTRRSVSQPVRQRAAAPARHCTGVVRGARACRCSARRAGKLRLPRQAGRDTVGVAGRQDRRWYGRRLRCRSSTGLKTRGPGRRGRHRSPASDGRQGPRGARRCRPGGDSRRHLRDTLRCSRAGWGTERWRSPEGRGGPAGRTASPPAPRPARRRGRRRGRPLSHGSLPPLHHAAGRHHAADGCACCWWASSPTTSCQSPPCPRSTTRPSRCPPSTPARARR